MYLAVVGVRRRALVAVAAALSLVATLFAVVPASAQEITPEHLAMARKYVDLTDRSAIYEATLVQTAVSSMRTIISQNPGMAEPVDAAITKILESYKDRKGELLDQFARVYALRFSADEMKQIVEFYESPTGTKLAQANADINGDLQRIMQIFEANLKTEFFAKLRSELKASGYDI